jgi:nitrogen fixation NifU-like protein
MVQDIFCILLGAGVLLALTFLWFGIYYWLTPHIKRPDGKARLTGVCGDTMEISLTFKGDRVTKSSFWTDGCAYSLNCVCAAADLAKGRSPDEILEIEADTIQESVGGLPRDQMHCAALSIETLHAALNDYMRTQRRAKPHSC